MDGGGAAGDRTPQSGHLSRAGMLTLRRATPADVPSAARLIETALAEYDLRFEPEGRDADIVTFGARPDHDDYVVEDGTAIVGLGSVGPQGAAGVAWVAKVFVAASARRLGAGRFMMATLHEAARARGFREVGLRSRVVFEAALAMYASLGYARREENTSGDVVLYRAL